MTSELKVYLTKIFVGTITKSDSNLYVFKYDGNYLIQDFCKEISVNLPLREEPFQSNKLHSFFDNLVSEGWLGERQAKAIKTNQDDKFKLLAYYGNDLIGGVHIKNKDNYTTNIAFDFQVNFSDDDLSSNNSKESVISINSDSTISGVQKKLLVFQTTQGEYKIVGTSYLSTYIAKCSSDEFTDLI